MVVGPEYNAIMGVALGIDKRDRQAILRGSAALLAGFLAAIIVTLLFGLAIRWSGHTPKAFSLGVRPVSSLIDKPNLFSVVVAVLAGIVGVVSFDRITGKRSHRRFHLGHHHSGSRRHSPVDRVRQLDRGLGLRGAVAARTSRCSSRSAHWACASSGSCGVPAHEQRNRQLDRRCRRAGHRPEAADDLVARMPGRLRLGRHVTWRGRPADQRPGGRRGRRGALLGASRAEVIGAAPGEPRGEASLISLTVY